MSAGELLLEVEGLRTWFPITRGIIPRVVANVRAVDGVSFTVDRHEVLGIAGESGSGKTTIGRSVLRLVEPTAGTIRFDGADVRALDPAGLRLFRRKAQIVFQDPFGSLDPRRRVGQTVAEPLALVGVADAAERAARCAEALEAVGLRAADATKYPHQFSGGQRQRIAIARALITRPKLIVADEPVSALDVSVQAQVLNLMQDLQDKFGLAMLFISHDLAVVDMVCDEVIVLYQGRIVEQGSPVTLFRQAAHPYTRALLQAVPSVMPPGQRLRRPPAAEASPPSTAGCAFPARCPWAEARCREQRPVLRRLGAAQLAPHAAACHRAEAVISTSDAAIEAAGGLTQNA